MTSSSMMPAVRNLPFPLMIICLVSIRGHCLLPTASRATGTPPDGDDYDDYDNDAVTPTRPVFPHPRQRCDYNPCSENQRPCHILSASTGCLCPGFSLNTDLPDVPELKSVSWNGSGVVAKWCAPYSAVKLYIVKVEGQEKFELGSDIRSCIVDDVDRELNVCVLARNDAGISESSCMMYKPEDNRLHLTAGLIGGGVGLLLLLLLVVLLWRCRMQKKQETRSL